MQLDYVGNNFIRINFEPHQTLLVLRITELEDCTLDLTWTAISHELFFTWGQRLYLSEEAIK